MIRRSLISLFCLSIITLSVSAEIPQIINYQGKVTEDGSPVADGDYTMTFTIYDAETSGSSQWSSGSMTVTVSDGIFSVLFGDTGQPTLDLEFDTDYWLEINIAGDIQSPRSRLGSVGYAYMASGLVPGTEVFGSVTSGTNAAVKGTNTATAGTTYGISGRSYSTDGRGVFGYAAATSGTTEGVYGESSSTSGRGVYGYATASSGTTYGLYGRSYSTDGHGVYGYATATSGTTYGVYGRSNSTGGRGVYGFVSSSGGLTYGVYGESYSTDGRGVFGYATASSGTTEGVYGESSSTSGRGVYGLASAISGTTYGVYGRSYSTDGRGIYGYTGATSGTTYGVYGLSNSIDGRGVYGYAPQSTGNGQGVRGESDSSTNGVGVYGLGSSTSGQNYGVFGRSNSPTGGYGVWCAGNFAVTGSKSCVVKTSQGPTLMYCQESPENWFEDFGEGQLVNGRCHIELDPLFLETVTIDGQNPMHVFIQPKGRCHGTFVETGTTGFDVSEQEDGTSNIAFSYRVVAKRKGFENKRLDYCKAAETDSYLYPELREKELQELETRRLGNVRD